MALSLLLMEDNLLDVNQVYGLLEKLAKAQLTLGNRL